MSSAMRGALSLLRADNYDSINGSTPSETTPPAPLPTADPTPTPAPTAPPAPLPGAYDAALILQAVVSKTSMRTPAYAAKILRELRQ